MVEVGLGVEVAALALLVPVVVQVAQLTVAIAELLEMTFH